MDVIELKFKFKGQDGQGCMTLVEYGFMDEEERLKHDQIIEVPDDHLIVKRMREHGLWEELGTKKKKSNQKPDETDKKGGR